MGRHKWPSPYCLSTRGERSRRRAQPTACTVYGHLSATTFRMERRFLQPTFTSEFKPARVDLPIPPLSFDSYPRTSFLLGRPSFVQGVVSRERRMLGTAAGRGDAAQPRRCSCPAARARGRARAAGVAVATPPSPRINQRLAWTPTRPALKGVCSVRACAGRPRRPGRRGHPQVLVLGPPSQDYCPRSCPEAVCSFEQGKTLQAWRGPIC